MVINGQAAVETTEIVATPLPVSLIDPFRLNRRCDEADADIAELAQTILQHGLIHPISVRPRDGGRYEIIGGERRWRAFRLLERETIPCIVKELSDTQAQIERIIENYQRRDPTFIEQGEAVATLMELTDRDIDEVANRLGQSASWVRRRAKLPNLIPAWREELEKENTPYLTIRDSVNKLEDLAVLPPATQHTLLDTNVLRYVKTTKEMRGIIARLFMNLDAKPWSRKWEKKEYSGSGKKRCDACIKRSDREDTLFADPDAPIKGESMCLDPKCWEEKCLSWSRNLINSNSGMVPIRQRYCYQNDGLGDYLGVEPVSYYDWQERDGAETEREGYAAAVGVFVDGPEIGTTKSVWLTQKNKNNAGDSDETGIDEWRDAKANKHQTRQEFFKIIIPDIIAHLADLDANTVIPAESIADRKLRALIWFGLFGYADSEEENSRPDDPDWNPLSWAWEQTAEHVARHIAVNTAEDISGDCDLRVFDDAIAAALIGMFEIPIDTITANAIEKLQGSDCDNAQDDTDAGEDSEPGATAIAVDVEALTDADDFISVDSVSFIPARAEA